MAPAVINTWTASYTIEAGNVVAPPGIASLACGVASSQGNWLVAFCSWTGAAGYLGATMAVADNTHGYWIPLGAPNGDSSVAGLTRCSIWARPASAAVPGASTVYMAPCGLPNPVYPTAMGITVIEVTGMSNYAGVPAVVPNYANASTSISASAAAPSGPALMLTVAASDAAVFSSGPGAGWTALTGVSVNAGAPAILYTSPAWRTASAAETASWATGTTGDLSACTATILVTSTGPSQPSATWPATQLQIGLGSGALTPPSQITWTDITPRLMTGHETSSTRGKGYELDQTQAGTITLVLDNNDGALTPGLTSSPYYPNVVADVPIRLLMTWAGRTYSVFSGFVERWPQTMDSATRFGLSEITVTDAWSLLGAPLSPCQREQILLGNPYSYWTCGDAAGSGYSQNSAPGNSNALVQVASKYGARASTAVFGENSGANAGDPSGTQWQQSGLLAADNTYGSCLYCADPGYPSLTSGITIMMWFSPVGGPGTTVGFGNSNATPSLFGQPATAFSNGTEVILTVAAGFTFPAGFTAGVVYYVVAAGSTTFELSATSGGTGIGSTAGNGFITIPSQVDSNIILARMSNSALGFTCQVVLQTPAGANPGAIEFTWADKVTRAASTTVVNTNNWFGGGHSHVALLLTQTTWQVVVDGGGFTGASGTCNLPPNFSWLSFMGSADRFSTGGMFNGAADNIAVFPGLLTGNQISQIYIGGSPAIFNGEWGSEFPSTRIERLMAYGGWAGPRAISQQTLTRIASISDIQGTEGGVAADGVVTAATGQQANQAITNIVITDGGWAFADGNGVLCYLSRGDLYNAPAQWFLGELNGSPLNTGWALDGTVAPWTVFGGATFVPSSAWTYDGYTSGLLTPNGTSSNPGFLSASTPGITAGTSYTLSTVVYCPAGWSGGVIALVDWYNASGGLISTVNSSAVPVPAAVTAGTLISWTATAPAGAVSCAFDFFANGTPASSTLFYFALPMIQPAASAGTAGEYSYTVDATMGYDKSLLYNQAQLTQSTGTGTPVTATNVASETQHGVSTYTATTYQYNIAQTGDQANWIVYTRSTPAERAEAINVDAGKNAAYWPFVLGVEPAQPVQVARRPILASGNTIVQAVVAQVKRTFNFQEGTASASIVTDAFPEGDVLTAGDPVRGLLNGTNVLAY